MGVEENYKKGFYEIFNHAYNSIAIFQLLKDDNGQPCDFTCVEVNRSFEKNFSICKTDFLRQSKTHLKRYSIAPSFDNIIQVYTTKTPNSYYFHDEKSERYFNVILYSPLDNIIVAVYHNITRTKMHEKALELHTHLGTRLSSINEELRACEEIVQSIVNLPYIDACGIYLIDWEKRCFVLKSHIGFSSDFVSQIQSLSLSSKEGMRLNSLEEPLFCTPSKLRLASIYIDENLNSIGILPIEYLGVKIGSVNVASKLYDQIPLEIQNELKSITYLIGSSLSRIIEVGKLKTNEEILRETIHQSSDGIVIMNSDFQIISSNQRIKNLLHDSSHNMQGRLFWEMLCNMHPIQDRSEKRVKDYRRLVEKAKETDLAKNHILIKMKVKKEDNQNTIHEISLFPIHLQTKKMFGAIVRDITKQVEIESLKHDIINNVSHEMRTPLTAIRSSMHLLKDSSVGSINEQQQEIVSICLRNINRLSTFIDNILDFQLVNDSSFCLTLQKHDVREVLLESTHFFTSIAYEKSIDIQTNIPSFPIEVKIDEKHFKKALFAIIANAVKRTQKGSIVLSVDFLPMQKKLQIHICDSGRGMQPSELRDMFIPCSPNNTSIDFINRNLPGINLALSKKIIQLHHGELWATSEQEKGCSFHIEMPYGTMHIT